jgi:hypothetical protein
MDMLYNKCSGRLIVNADGYEKRAFQAIQQAYEANLALRSCLARGAKDEAKEHREKLNSSLEEAVQATALVAKARQLGL